MRNFKSFLLHEDTSQFLTNKEEIMDWLDANNIGRYGSKFKDYEFDTEGRVQTTEDLQLLGEYCAKQNNHLLPIRFLKCNNCEIGNLNSMAGAPEIVKDLTITPTNNFRSLIGIPQKVRGSFYFTHHGFLDAIDDFPKEIQGGHNNTTLNFIALRLKSLSGIHKHSKVINGIAYIGGYELTEALLGLLKIKSVTSYAIINKFADRKDLISAFKLINTHYKEDGSGDILDCKEDLMSVGLKSYAKL